MHYRIDRDQTGKLSIPDGKKFDTLWQVCMGVFNLIFYCWLGVFVLYLTSFMLVLINLVFLNFALAGGFLRFAQMKI